MEANSDAPGLARVFAPMLSELEDHATRLTARQAEMARELAAVDEELQRVEAVRAAMIGKASRGPGRPPGRPKGSGPALSTSAKQARERAEAVIRFAREKGSEFTGREVANALGVSWQGVGPTLAGMARRGELVVREDAGTNFYALP